MLVPRQLPVGAGAELSCQTQSSEPGWCEGVLGGVSRLCCNLPHALRKHDGRNPGCGCLHVNVQSLAARYRGGDVTPGCDFPLCVLCTSIPELPRRARLGAVAGAGCSRCWGDARLRRGSRPLVRGRREVGLIIPRRRNICWGWWLAGPRASASLLDRAGRASRLRGVRVGGLAARQSPTVSPCEEMPTRVSERCRLPPLPSCLAAPVSARRGETTQARLGSVFADRKEDKFCRT